MQSPLFLIYTKHFQREKKFFDSSEETLCCPTELTLSIKCLSLAFPLESVKAPYFSVGVYECSVMGFSKYCKRDLLEIYFDLFKTTYPDTYSILAIQI